MLFQWATVLLVPLLEELLLVLPCCLLSLQLHLLSGDKGKYKILSSMCLVSGLNRKMLKLIITVLYEIHFAFASLCS